MKNRPAFKKYARHFPAFMISQPAVMGDKVYAIRDYPLILLGNIAIIVMMFFLNNYSPFTPFYYGDTALTVAIDLGILLSAAYWLFFVYRFARYYITWADRMVHPYPSGVEGYDSGGDPLPSAESKRSKWRSRGAFIAFTAGIGVLITLYCLLGFGMAPIRILNDHKADLEKLVEIGNKYDYLWVCNWGNEHNPLSVYGTAHDPKREDLTQEEREELTNIFHRLQGNYVHGIFKENYDEKKRIKVVLFSIAASGELTWYPDKSQWVYNQGEKD